jgi:hypothetical protein
MKQKTKEKYLFVFECGGCCLFYGEQTLNKNGELLCPECEAPQEIDSVFVEKVAYYA